MKKYITFFLMAVLLVTGCGKEDCPTDPGNGVEDDPSFTQDIQPIFNDKCAIPGCHNSSAAAGLDLSADKSYASLYDRQSGQENDTTLVDPGNSQESYLVIKIETPFARNSNVHKNN